jgi:hypothetical protein
MSIVGRFEADFSSFQAAVQKAEVSLKSMDVGAAKVSASLSKMADSFSGRKVIQDALLSAEAVNKIGGAAKLTASEQAALNAKLTEALAKYKALGMEAPKHLTDLARSTKAASTEIGGMAAGVSKMLPMLASLGIGLSAGTVIAFGKSMLDSADSIVKMADKTGLALSEVQKLDFIAKQSGNSIEQLSGAIGQMQNRLTEGDEGAVGAVKRLGINLEQLRAASPFEQMETLAQAIAKIPDPAQRSKLAMDLFGRSGIEILPSLVSKFKELGDAAPVMSDKTVKSLDETGDAISRLGGQFRVFVADALEPYVDHLSRLPEEQARAKRALALLGLDVQKLAEDWQDLKRAMDAVRQTPIEAPKLPGATTFGKAPALVVPKATKEDLRDLEDLVAATTKALLAGSKAAAAYAASLKKMREDFTGVTAVKAAQDLVLALKDVTNIQTLSASHQEQVNKVMGEAIDVFTRTGRVAPQAMRDLWNATRQVPPVISGLAASFKDLGVQVANANGKLFTFEGLAQKVQSGIKPVEAFEDNIQPFNVIAAGADAAAKKIQDMTGAVHSLAQAMGTLGSNTGGRTGAVIQGLAGMTAQVAALRDTLSSLDATSTTGQKLAAGFQSLAIVGSFVQIGMAIYDAFTAADKQLRQLKRDAIDSAGGMQALRDAALVTGRDVDAIFRSDSIELFQHDMALLSREIATTNSRLQRLGLTWRDMNETVRQGTIDAMARQIISDADFLFDQVAPITGKFTDSALSGLMEKTFDTLGGSLNQLVVDAVKTGSKIPKALQPMLESLIRAGRLSEDAAKALLGIADNGVPAFKEIEDAANRYGIELDSLGSAVQQIRINEISAQMVRDFKFITEAGGDVNAVLAGMSDEVQDVVTQAQRLGISLPENMRPILQAMVDAGLLTDQFGNRLTDLEGLNFQASLTDKIEELIDAIKALIDETDRFGDNAVEQFERARNAAEILGRAVPRILPPVTGAGGGAPTGEPTGGEAVPRPDEGTMSATAPAGVTYYINVENANGTVDERFVDGVLTTLSGGRSYTRFRRLVE